MLHLSKISQFLRNEDGAVTVDWVVLTAATVGLGIASYAAVSPGIDDLSTDTSAQMSGFAIQTSFDVAPAITPTTQALNLASDTGYRDLDFYFFNDTGVENFSGKMSRLSNQALQDEIANRVRYVESEMAMGPNDAPSYGAPWGHTDMYNLARWEAERRGLDYAKPDL